MSPAADPHHSPPISDDLIEEAVSRIDMTARLVGPRRTLFIDVAVPRSREAPPGPLLFLMRAAVELHAEIQSSDELSDIEETLEDSLKADDDRGIEEGCEIYRSLLISRLKDIWRSHRGTERIARLGAAQPLSWSA
jgi:hypothetical protein